MPLYPLTTISLVPPTEVATTGFPCANASIGVSGNPSVYELKTTTSNCCITFCGSFRYPEK